MANNLIVSSLIHGAGIKDVGAEILGNSHNSHETRPEEGVEIFTAPRRVN